MLLRLLRESLLFSRFLNFLNVELCRHKTLRGPRAGLVFFRKDGPTRADLEKRVNDAVFPACQGGPHNNTIAGIATALKQAADPSWKAYAKQVVANARALADELVKEGYKLQTGGTDNHLVLWDLRPLGLTGSKVEKVGDLLGITINSAFRFLPSSFSLCFFEYFGADCVMNYVEQRTPSLVTSPPKSPVESASAPPPSPRGTCSNPTSAPSPNSYTAPSSSRSHCRKRPARSC